MMIGAQLYTVRDYCRNLNDFAETLKKVADIGYKTVQVSGTCSYSPTWLKEELDKNGLRCVLTHTSPERMKYDPEAVMEEHKIFGCNYIGIGCAPCALQNGEKDLQELFSIVDAAAKKFSSNGFYLMYHNHALEFARSMDGRTYFERILEKYSPELLGFTLDTYWLQAGGVTPSECIRSLKGRVPCVHLKDMGVKGNAPIMEAVSSGNLDFNAILTACEEADTEYLLVEQDDCNGENPFVCLKKSYEFLKARGFE